MNFCIVGRGGSALAETSALMRGRYGRVALETSPMGFEALSVYHC